MSASRRGEARQATTGFTLIEMVVALVLMTLIGLLLFESLKFAQRSYDRVVRRGNDSWQVFATQRLIRSLVENARPGQTVAGGTMQRRRFSGGENEISLTAPAPLADGGSGLYHYEIRLHEEMSAKQKLIIRWYSDFADDAAGAEEILLEKVRAVRWSYRARGADDAQSAWTDSWPNSDELPGWVRLQIDFAPDDARRWPELIIAPRITADSNCQFDAVAQRCRSTS